MSTRVALLTIMALIAPSAHAYVGTITGTITGVDTRPNLYDRMGFGFDPSGARQHQPRFESAIVPVREVLVHFRACNSVGVCAEHWTLTSTSGVYSIPWTLATAPSTVLLEVWAQRPDISAGVVTSGSARPPHQFRIGTVGIPDTVIASTAPPLPSGSGVTQTVNMQTGASEFLAAYLTAVETYAMLDVQHQPSSGSLRNDMDGVNIFAFYSYDAELFGGYQAVTPDSWQIWMTPYTAWQTASVPAHELGHILAYRSFDRLTPVALRGDYTRDKLFVQGAWSDFSDEYGKASFQEALGVLVEAMWLWTRSANPPAPIGDPFGLGTNPAYWGTDGPTSLELATQRPGSGPSCGTGVDGARRAMCNARALWDIVDNPAGENQDAITSRDLGDVVAVLRSYPHNCTYPYDNRCDGENGSDDGVNWSDFRARFEALFGQSLSSIESTNDLAASPDW